MSTLTIKELEEQMIAMAKQKPFYFYDLLQTFNSATYRQILIVWGMMREQIEFERDEEGRYICPKT